MACMRRVSVILSIGFLGLISSASAKTIGLTGPLAPVAAWDGFAAFSDYDTVSRTFSLWSDAGDKRHHLPLGDQRTAYDMDVGPGPDRATLVAYSECRSQRADKVGRTLSVSGCDIKFVGIDTPGPSVPPAAADPQVSELHPSVFGDNLAWVSRPDRPGAREDVVLAPLGSSSATTTLPLLSGFPARSRVEDLELGEVAVAAVVRVPSTRSPTRARTEVVAGPLNGPFRRYASARQTGSGVRYVGVALSGHQLTFARACLYSGKRCRHGHHGLFRVKLGSRRFSRADAPARIGAFDFASGVAYWGTADLRTHSGCPSGGCTVQQVRNVAFKRSSHRP
jgi:hypothetical protein